MKFSWRRLLKKRRRDDPVTALQKDEPGEVAELGEDQLPPESEMSFLEHLEDLRWTIIKGIAGVVVMVIVASIFNDWIIDTILMGPAKSNFITYQVLGIEAQDLNLLNRTITGQFFALIGIVVAVGLVAGSPFLIYYAWRFIEPGLYPLERKGMRFIAAFATFFFVIGVLFGYFVIAPLALHFFNSFVISETITNDFDIMRYFSGITWWSFGAGLLFELPVVIYILTKLGIATPERLRKTRKYAFVGTFVLGAIITPADPVSMIIAAVPLYALYEGSIYISAWTERRRVQELKEAWGEA